MHGVRGGWTKPRSPRKKVKGSQTVKESESGWEKVNAEESKSERRKALQQQITIECQLSAQILEDAQLNLWSIKTQNV